MVQIHHPNQRQVIKNDEYFTLQSKLDISTMIYFIIAWSLLAIVCFITGTYLLNLLKASCFVRIGDRLIIAIWSGLMVISILLLAISFVFPLSLLTGGVVAAILITLSLLSSSTRAELIRLKSAFSIDWLSAFVNLSLLSATLFNRSMKWFDTGGYHIGAIKWLHEAGTVPGVALINYAFGFTSSWFAFTAPLTPGFLGHHIGGVTNGFIFFLATFHILIALTHVKQKHSTLSDWFAIVIFLVIIVTYVTTIFTNSPILISFSPDVPVTLATGIIAWTILVIKERAADEKTLSPHSVSPAFDVKTLPLVLGVGALSLKLSALPVLAIVILFYCFESRFAPKKLFIGAILVILLALPMISYGFITSGCPMFPSTIACINFSWRFPQEEAINQLEATRVLQSRDSKTPETKASPAGPLETTKGPQPREPKTPATEASSATENLSSFLEKRFAWIRIQSKMQIMLLLYAISIALSIQQLLFFRNRKSQVGVAWVNGLGILGMTFIICYAPLIRFGFIYFILVCGLFLAQFINHQYNNLANHAVLQQLFSVRLNKASSRVLALVLTSCFLIILAEDQRRLFSLLPPELPRPELIEAQVNDVKYTYPTDWSYKCWATPLPCSGIVLDNIRLRKPAQGIHAGFIRVP
ncbi:MAG TPA: hypothetical protein VIQ31_28945 [Phormidium sp.]